MEYVEGFVAAVPTDAKEEFKKHAKDAALIFKEYGAIQIVECWGDDVPEGKVTSFPMAVKLKEGETVVFSWVSWPDKKTRNRGMEKMMTDPRMQPDQMPMPFDGTRMIFGGFQQIVKI